jgi:site-specific DNA-cytosine methylase
VILENVPEVLDNGEGDYLMEQFQQRGFWVRICTFCASTYGSGVPRERTYIIAIKCELPDSDWGKLTVAHTQFLNGMKIEPMSMDRFVPAIDFVRKSVCMQLHDVEEFSFQKGGDVYKDEHYEMFRANGLRWPPEVGRTSAPHATHRTVGVKPRCTLTQLIRQDEK